MKELYSFTIDRKIEKIVTKNKIVDGETIETNETVVEKKPVRVIVKKPNTSLVEDAEFFYGQKFNFFINNGFLTRAMLAKKLGDFGGSTSKKDEEFLSKHILDNVEASRVIEFYGEAKELDKEQKEELENAKKLWAYSGQQIRVYEEMIRNQYSQTADAKAEQQMLEWLIFNLSFFEESVDGKNEIFPLFVGANYEEKRSFARSLEDDLDAGTDASTFKRKSIAEAAYTTLARVAGIWYNKLGDDQESIDRVINDLFSEKKQTESTPKKTKTRKTKKTISE